MIDEQLKQGSENVTFLKITFIIIFLKITLKKKTRERS